MLVALQLLSASCPLLANFCHTSARCRLPGRPAAEVHVPCPVCPLVGTPPAPCRSWRAQRTASGARPRSCPALQGAPSRR
uniref:Putative secreted protein n=1 Tax=Ixodes ricinus TaxID=34613 RepID=A0A6B0U643_IXORI